MSIDILYIELYYITSTPSYLNQSYNRIIKVLFFYLVVNTYTLCESPLQKGQKNELHQP